MEAWGRSCALLKALLVGPRTAPHRCAALRCSLARHAARRLAAARLEPPCAHTLAAAALPPALVGPHVITTAPGAPSTRSAHGVLRVLTVLATAGVQAPRALGGVFGTSKFPPAAVEPLYTEPVRPSITPPRPAAQSAAIG